jgi:phospholipid/cholesterol/gamma-HCH transport system substrate-binding protein
MKFKIRYADQLVGVLVIIALLSLIFVIFMIGRAQRWFSVNHTFVTYARSASGINSNMPVTCRGFVIGNVKTYDLTGDNRKEVIFTIQDEYKDRAREGSLVEVLISPIGLGGQFILYPGNGRDLEEGALIPMRDSPEAREYLNQGLANIPAQEDPIADLLEKVNGIVGGLQEVVDGLAIKSNENPTTTSLGQTIANIEQITGNLAADLANPNGVRGVINGDAETLHALEASLVSLSGILDNMDKAVAYIPREMPQILNLISEARTVIVAAEDVLISLRNNPLLRRGIPAHAEIDSSGTNPRNIRF